MLHLRRMPKNLGSFVVLGCIVPMMIVLMIFLYSNEYADSTSVYTLPRIRTIFSSDDLHQDAQQGTFASSFAYKKQEELGNIDDDETNKVTELDEDFKQFEVLSYKESLRRTADPTGFIVIKLCDGGRFDTAVNFHEMSIVRNELQNVLYVSPDPRVCHELKKMEVKCHILEEDFMYFNNTRTLDDQRDRTKRLSIAKIKLILKGLTLGYTILFTDASTLYTKNPLEAMQCDEKCDAALSVDNVNMRFVNFAVNFARPRHSTVYMYARLLTIIGTVPSVSTKDTLNNILEAMIAKNQIAVQFLNAEIFAPASNFFLVRRFYEDRAKCRTCVAIFEDRDISHDDQVYQLKEQRLWYANFDEYYTSRRRMYLVYENVWEFGEKRSITQELLALRNALAIGKILGRVVILPRFHCPESLFEMKFCGLSDLLKMSYFDHKFKGLYREHTFLSHPEVSREVRRSVTDPYFLGKSLPSEQWDKDADIRPREKITFVQPKHSKGLTEKEIKAAFATESTYSLLFHSLYDGGFTGFDNKADTTEFNKMIKSAFHLTTPVHTIVDSRSFEFEQ